MTLAAPSGTCVVCGATVAIVNFTRNEFGRGLHGGYLGRHHRAGTRAGTKCSGSFGAWSERKTTR